MIYQEDWDGPRASPAKTKAKLGRQAEWSLGQLIVMMIDADLNRGEEGKLISGVRKFEFRLAQTLGRANVAMIIRIEVCADAPEIVCEYLGAQVDDRFT